jgi:hypothetical protein
MSADSRLTVLQLAGRWGRKVELNELALDTAWNLLLERIAPLATCSVCGQTPCPDASYCQTMRAADEKIAASRKCAQCGAGSGELEPHGDNERRKIVYLHRGCVSFWQRTHR